MGTTARLLLLAPAALLREGGALKVHPPLLTPKRSRSYGESSVTTTPRSTER
jgi:hypothetical protein